MRTLVQRIAKEIQNKNKIKLDYIIGMMIELLELHQAKPYQNMQIFLAGTNDLTQTTFGISRDDLENF